MDVRGVVPMQLQNNLRVSFLLFKQNTHDLVKIWGPA